jgi:hypothetical protein
MMHVADGTFSCGARTAMGPTAIPGWSQIDRLLLRMSPFVADIVAKVENRITLKISPKLIFGLSLLLRRFPRRRFRKGPAGGQVKDGASTALP